MNSPYARFVNKLVELTQNNKNISIIPGNRQSIRIEYRPGPVGTYLIFDPANNNRAAYLNFGHTHVNDRGKGLGTRLRNYGVRAAQASGVPLYQYGINLNFLVKKNEMPISTRIMRKLGAVPTYKRIPGLSKKKKWQSVVRAHPYSTRYKR